MVVGTTALTAYLEKLLAPVALMDSRSCFLLANKPAGSRPATLEALLAMAVSCHVLKRAGLLMFLGGMECLFIGKPWVDGTFAQSEGGAKDAMRVNLEEQARL